MHILSFFILWLLFELKKIEIMAAISKKMAEFLKITLKFNSQNLHKTRKAPLNYHVYLVILHGRKNKIRIIAVRVCYFQNPTDKSRRYCPKTVFF